MGECRNFEEKKSSGVGVLWKKRRRGNKEDKLQSICLTQHTSEYLRWPNGAPKAEYFIWSEAFQCLQH